MGGRCPKADELTVYPSRCVSLDAELARLHQFQILQTRSGHRQQDHPHCQERAQQDELTGEREVGNVATQRGANGLGKDIQLRVANKTTARPPGGRGRCSESAGTIRKLRFARAVRTHVTTARYVFY